METLQDPRDQYEWEVNAVNVTDGSTRYHLKGINHFVLKILAVKEHWSAPQKHGGCTCRKDVTMFDQCVTNGGKNPLTCIHDALAQKASI